MLRRKMPREPLEFPSLLSMLFKSYYDVRTLMYRCPNTENVAALPYNNLHAAAKHFGVRCRNF